MRIGYACLNIGVINTQIKTCRLKNANNLRLMEITQHNLNSLENIIDYNIQNNIRLFRISSDLIPFASSAESHFEWQEQFSQRLKFLGDKAKQNHIRLSMHPGQYTVLNSPFQAVVKRAIADLEYHCQLLDIMGFDGDSKIILHIGGVYKDKKEAIRRFVNNYNALGDNLKRRIVLENDDKSYNIKDVLHIGTKLGIPVVFDNLHNTLNPCEKQETDSFWIKECKKTWKEQDGCQKIHYSQQDQLKKAGSHSLTIRVREFTDFCKSIDVESLDVMLEVKDKNLSAVKCINCITDYRHIKMLENEWSKYKYSVLEKSPENYVKIRKLLNNKDEYPCIDFYELVDEALCKESSFGKVINAVQHIWGYFKNKATEKEKEIFFNKIEKFEKGKILIGSIKRFLYKMSIKYDEKYLLESYYFIL